MYYINAIQNIGTIVLLALYRVSNQYQQQFQQEAVTGSDNFEQRRENHGREVDLLQVAIQFLERKYGNADLFMTLQSPIRLNNSTVVSSVSMKASSPLLLSLTSPVTAPVPQVIVSNQCSNHSFEDGMDLFGGAMLIIDSPDRKISSSRSRPND